MKDVVLFLFAVIQFASAYSYTRSALQQTNTRLDPLDWTRTFTFEANVAAAAQKAVETGKPIMIIQHLERCPACKRLIKALNDDPQVKAEAANFVVVHSVDGSDPAVDRIQPDSLRYYPKIFVMTSDQEILKSITSGSRDYPYYYSSSSQLLYSLRRARTATA